MSVKNNIKTLGTQLTAVILICLLCSCKHTKSVSKAQNEKPNIVFIFTDDQTYSAIHALGNNEIITPNMDRLVKMGVSFTNTYNMGAWGGAVCVTSRAMIISGRTIWHARQMQQYWEKNDSIEKTWPKLLERNGYNTYMTCKWHV